jgi:Fimbrial assembly protein (PilN)
MISFDFSRSAPPEFLRRVLEFRIPDRYHAALMALTGVALTIAGAWSIESHRLHQTLRLQAFYQRRYDSSVHALARANVFEARVKRLSVLAARVRTIRASGYADARRLAEIANNLPRHAWLTSIAYDGDAVSLEGRARDLGVLSDVIRGLTRAPHLHEPVLSSATVVSDKPEKGTIKYVLRVQSD